MRKAATIILLAIIAFNVATAWRKNGQKKPEYLNTYDLKLTLISLVILLALYYYAGLFDCFTE